MNYLLILCTVLLLAIQTLCFKEFSRTYMKNVASYFTFNFSFFSVVVIVFILSGVRIGGYALETVLLGASFGVVFIVAIFCYMKAMASGPLSFTILFSSFGILIPVLFGVFLWDEPINLIQVAGLVLLLLTFYLGSGSAKGSKQKVNVKWLFYCFINFLGNGLIMSIAKWHQIILPGQEIKEFLVMSFGTAALLSFILFIYYRLAKKQMISHLQRMPLVAIVIATGVTTAYGNQLLVYLASRLPSIIQFPAINGGIVIVTTLASYFVFKEKLTRRTGIGINLGIVSLILLSVN